MLLSRGRALAPGRRSLVTRRAAGRAAAAGAAPSRINDEGGICSFARAALRVQRLQQLLVDSPIPWEPVTRASWGSFLLHALCFQDECLVALQVSGPRDPLSCVTAPAGQLRSSRRRTLRTLMKSGLPGSKVRGRRNQSRPADTDLFRSGCISGLNQGAGSFVQQTSKMPNSVSHSKGLFV